MKRSYLAAAFLTLLVSAVSFAQDRPRILDNFSTSRGVTVYRTESIPLPKAIVVKSGKRGKNTVDAKFAKIDPRQTGTGKKLVAPTVMSSPTAQRSVRMNVSEGLADREMNRGSIMNAS